MIAPRAAASLFAAGLALAACQGAPPGGPPAASSASTGEPLGAPSATSAPPEGERSIYALRMTLRDQDGATVGLDAFRGKPVLVGMFYGRCPSACPLLVSTIQRTLSQLDPDTAAEVRVLLVSFDPEHDTPEALRAITRERGLDSRWKLASAPDDQVRELAAVLGVQFRKLPDGRFSHTARIVLLDRSGSIDARLDDMTEPVDPLAARARVLSRAR